MPPLYKTPPSPPRPPVFVSNSPKSPRSPPRPPTLLSSSPKSSRALLQMEERKKALPPRARTSSNNSVTSASSTKTHRRQAAKPEHRQRSKSWASPPTENNTTNKLVNLQQLLKSHIASHGKKHAHNTAIYNQIGNIYFRGGDLASAKKSYKKAIQCNPGEHTAAAYLNLGTVYWSTGDVHEAIPLLKQALGYHKLDSKQKGETDTEASVHHQLGLCYALCRDFDAALDSMKRALKIRESLANCKSDVSVGKTWDAIGKIYFLRGDFVAALEHHKRAHKILNSCACTSVTVLQNLVNVYMAKGEEGQALGMLGEITTLQRNKMLDQPRESPLFQNAARDLQASLYAMALLYDRKGMPREADACRKHAVSLP